MSSPKTHRSEVSALETVKKLHKGHTTLSSKLLIAHVVEGTIKILESAKSTGLKAEVDRLESANQGLKLNKERKHLGGIISDIAKDLGTKSETEIKRRISDLEKTNETIIGASVDLIVQLANLKRAFKKHTSSGKPKPSPRPKPTPVPPPALHTPPVAPNIIGSKHIVITSLPPSESITGGVNSGETLLLSRDGGTTWSTVATNPSNNFDIKITERTNGVYPYRLKTKNVAGTESGEETVIVEINVPSTITAPKKPTITSVDTFSVDTPTITGSTTANSQVEIYEGATKIGDGIADARGNFSITTNALTYGPHALTVKAIHPTDSSKISQENTRITINKPLVLNPVSVDASSANIERGTANPQLILKDTVIGSKVRITNTDGKILFEGLINKHDASGKFKVTLRGLDTRKVGPEDITIEAIDTVSGNIEPSDQTLNITEQKIKFTHPPKAALTKPGKQENDRSFSVNLDDIIPGSKVQIRNSRIPGGVEEVYGNSKTFAQNLYNMDTKTPSTGPEELIIQMIDPHDPTNKSAEIRIPFEIDSPVLSLERPDMAPIDKLNHGDDIKFQMTNAVEGTEVRISGPGLSTTKRIDIPSGGSGDYELDLGIRATNPPFIPGKKYDFKVEVEDPKHRGKKIQTTVKIEIDHPILTLSTPVISNTTPVEIRQGAPSKGFLNVTNATPGAEYILVLPNGSEVPAGKAAGTTHAVSLNNLSIDNVGPQSVIIKVKDPHHDTVRIEQSTIDLEIKKKVEAPRHLPQPVFKVPIDYSEGGLDPEIELLNAVANSEVNIEYDTAGGRVTTSPLTITADGIMKMPLAGFHAPTGTSNIRVTYRNPVSGAQTMRDIPIHVAPRPSIERPEGFQDEVDITTKPTQIKVGKLKPGQTMVVAHSDGSTPPLSRGTDGTHTFPIPANMCSEKQLYTVTVTDTTGATENFPLTVNVKIPPKANRRIDHHNFVHACEEAKKHGTGHYRINGEAHPFDVTKGWGKYKTTIHGENFKAKTPDELFKIVKKHLDHENQHEKDEYNAYWGLMPESSDHDKHKPGDHDEKDNGKKKDHTGDEKGGHGEKGGNENSAGFFGAVKTIVTTPVTLFNKQPAWVRGAEIGLGYAAWAGGAVSLGPAIMGGAAFGATWWALKKLWNIKNGTKGGDSSGAHH